MPFCFVFREKAFETSVVDWVLLLVIIYDWMLCLLVLASSESLLYWQIELKAVTLLLHAVNATPSTMNGLCQPSSSMTILYRVSLHTPLCGLVLVFVLIYLPCSVLEEGGFNPWNCMTRVGYRVNEPNFLCFFFNHSHFLIVYNLLLKMWAVF